MIDPETQPCSNDGEHAILGNTEELNLPESSILKHSQNRAVDQ
jgi:hypothetical protein